MGRLVTEGKATAFPSGGRRDDNNSHERSNDDLSRLRASRVALTRASPPESGGVGVQRGPPE